MVNRDQMDRSDLYLRNRAIGEAKGWAVGVLRVLAARKLPVSDEIRERVSSCTDIEQLEEWVTRAATAESLDDVFD